MANALFYGDNLVWLRDHKHFPDDSVDLIYLDPPFNSKANYNVLFNEPGKENKSQAQIKAFDDTWHWDSEASAIALNELALNKPQVAEFISWLSRLGKSQESTASYLSMMATRLIELQRVLKPTGSIYLHCDPTASHYLKLLLDQIFGMDNFRNEIVWCFRGGGSSNKNFGHRHNIILRYSKSSDYNFYPDPIRIPYQAEGLHRTDDAMWGKHKGTDKVYKPNPLGKIPEDWWPIDILNANDPERLGYPTQKPLSLLERIVKSSSKEGDIVLDPFCGCGTSIDAAEKWNRKWLGIDVTWLAIDLIEKRLKRLNNEYGSKVVGAYAVHGKPFDLASAEALANKNKKEFEIWAITLVNANPREHDGGVDGIFGFVEKDKSVKPIVVQIKGGDQLNPGMVRDLMGTVKNEKAAIGLLITLREPTDGMKSLAVHSQLYHSDLWDRDYPSIQIRTIPELLSGKEFDLPPTQNLFKKAPIVRDYSEQPILLKDSENEPD